MENLHDIWSYQHSNERDYSYFSPSKNTHSRIDLILIDGRTLTSALHTSIEYITWSDHAPISLTISCDHNYLGNSLWRMNTYLLKSPNISTEIQTALSEYFSINGGSVSSPATLWCAHKAFIRGILLAIGAREKRKRQYALSSLLSDLKQADREFKDSPTPDNKSKFSLIQEKLRSYYLQDYERSLKRLKLSYYSHGDRAGKFLANRVKTLQAKNKIPYISSVSQGKICDPRLIADAFAEY